MPSVTFNDHDLTAWTKDLEKAAAIAPAEAAKVVTKGAVNIKADARRRISGLAHAPAYPRSITFDPVHVNRTVATTEIGPDKGKRQGPLGNILEYGAPGRNTPPHPHMSPAAEAEMPRFARAMEALAVKAIEP